MAETLLQYQQSIVASDGSRYEARACGRAMPGGTWEGWIEFVPIGGGPAVHSPRETTQPNRTDAEYWATGLTHVYLEGALRRALDSPIVVATTPPQPSVFPGPAPSRQAPAGAPVESVLNPFSVYEKGEALLRKQLGVLASWHLVNIIAAYELSTEDMASLNRRSAPDLIEIIVSGVSAKRDVAARRT
jgi:hypothetical protein